MMKSMTRIGSICLVGLLGIFTANAQQTDTKASGTASAETKQDTAAKPPATSDTEYKIGPQDILRIDVWKEPEITRTIPVRPDGKISLPLLNDVQAAGLTAMQLAGVIRDALTKYITTPQVTVTVSEINSRRVFVTGEVAKQGALPLLPGMTALQAMASAGGFTQFSKPTKIYILRTTDGKQEKIPFNYKEVVKGKSPDIPLLAGDVIVVP